MGHYCRIRGPVLAGSDKPSGMVVPEHVSQLTIAGDWVVGLVEYDRLAPAGSQTHAGHFALNTLNHERYLAMSESEWLDFLGAQRITTGRPMLSPSRAVLRELGRSGKPPLPRIIDTTRDGSQPDHP